MSSTRRWLSRWYLLLAVVALIACWRQNLAFMAETHVSLPEAFVTFWPALLVNHATTSITVDLFMVVLVVLTWMILESRRVGMRGVWLYVVLSFAIAISVTVPMFLAMRERRLDALGEPAPTATVADRLGIAALALPILAFAVYTLVG